MNGRSHATLLDFGYDECPKCDEDLRAAPVDLKSDFKAAAKEGEQEKGGQEKDGDEKDGDEGAPPVSDGVNYSLTCSDGPSYSAEAETMTLSKPFSMKNFRKERKVKHKRESIVFSVDTKLNYGQRVRSRMRWGDENSEYFDYIFKRYVDGTASAITTMLIHSPLLVKTLAKLVSYYPSVNFDGHTLGLEEPYCLLAHYMRELKAYQSTFEAVKNASEEDYDLSWFVKMGLARCDERTHSHIQMLLDFLRDNVYHSKIEEEEERIAKDPAMCTFEMLWYILKPGITIYTEDDGRREAYVIQSVTVGPSVLSTTRRNRRPYSINMFYLDFDGTHVGRVQRTITISEFQGSVRSRLSRLFRWSILTESTTARPRPGLRNKEKNGTSTCQLSKSITRESSLAPKTGRYVLISKMTFASLTYQDLNIDYSSVRRSCGHRLRCVLEVP